MSLLMVCAALARADDPLAAHQSQYPGVRARSLEGRIAYLFDAPMTRAETPEVAAAAFLAEHGRAFGVGELELEPARWIAATPRCRQHYISWVVTDGPFLIDRIRVAVNMPIVGGNAWYVYKSDNSSCLGLSTLAFPYAQSQYLNICYSGFFAHEYGHQVTYEIMGSSNWGPRAFLEGYGGVASHLINNDAVQGRGFNGDNDRGSMIAGLGVSIPSPAPSLPAYFGDPTADPYDCQYPIPAYGSGSANPPGSECICDDSLGGAHKAGAGACRNLGSHHARVRDRFRDAGA